MKNHQSKVVHLKLHENAFCHPVSVTTCINSFGRTARSITEPLSHKCQAWVKRFSCLVPLPSPTKLGPSYNLQENPVTRKVLLLEEERTVR